MKQQKKFYELLENFTTAVVVHNSNTEVLYANQAALTFLGLDLDQIQKKTATDPHWHFIREDGSKMPVDEFPVLQVLASGKTLKNLVVGIIRSELENPVWALCNAHPEFDQDGNISQVVVNFTDMTERKQAEKKLKDIAEQLHNTYTLARIGVWTWVVGTDTRTWTEELYRITGLDPKCPLPTIAEMIKFHTPNSWERQCAAVKKTLTTGEPYQLELEFVHTSGAIKIVNSFGSVKRDIDGTVIEMYGMVQDITEKKQAELELKLALESAQTAALMKSRFLDTAAHELRTPVAAFSLLLQFTQKKLEEKNIPVDSATLSRLRSQVERISQLVIELLDVSRLERGVLSLRPRPTNIISMISQSIEDFKLRGPHRQIEFLHPEHSIELCIDNLRIFQVLSNLIDNALKYTPDTTPIEVFVKQAQDSVCISVKDYGQGISEKFQEELFSPFSRGPTDLNEEQGGLGLGLFISREIISLHGGNIGVTSTIGQGSTFYFELPTGIKEL